MRKNRHSHHKETAERIAMYALLPLFLLFRQIGRKIKCLSTKGRQLTASALCAAIIIGAVPITALASGSNFTKINEFKVNGIAVNVEKISDDYWVYGTSSKIVSTNAQDLPENGWTWAIRVNYTKAEYEMKLNGYDGGAIIASNIVYGDPCKLAVELQRYNYIESAEYGMRFSSCDTVIQGDGSLNITTTNTFSAISANSLTVKLKSTNSLNIKASKESESEYTAEGISASKSFVLENGDVYIKIENNTSNYSTSGIVSENVTVNGGMLSITATNSAQDGKSYGICGKSKYNSEIKGYEYLAQVYFNNGGIEIQAGTMAVNSTTAPVAAQDLKLWAGKNSDKSDKAAYNADDFKSYTYLTNEHTHCICGSYTSHEKQRNCLYYEPIKYKPWSDPTSLPSGYTSYYLTTDVVLDGSWNMNCEMHLCLNGHSIIANGDFDTIVLGRILYLSDCSEHDKQGKITHTEGKTGSGISTRKYNGSMGGLRMFGGMITGNTAENGGGINCGTKAYIIIKGGSITNNVATQKGGGIYCEGDATVYDCKISNNKASYGGGVYVAKGTDQYSIYDSFISYGGDITENTATQKGGGVYAAHYFVLEGDESRYGSKIGTNYTTVLNNTSGEEGNKKTDNVSLAEGQYVNMYYNFTGGKVSVNTTGIGTVIGITYRNLTSDFRLSEIAMSNLRCDDSRYVPGIDYEKNQIILKSALKELKATDFTFTAPSDLLYNGVAKSASVKAAYGINCGNITVRYYNESGVETAPIHAGTYTVKIDVEENSIYGGVTGLTDSSWKFTVKPKEISTDEIVVTGISGTYIYNQKAQKPVPNVTVNGQTLQEGKDYRLSYSNNTDIGHATVTVTLTGDYSGSRTTEFLISYGHASNLMYTQPDANKNGWYRGSLTITAKDGFEVGESLDSFSDSIVISQETERGGKRIFARANDTGNIYETIISYKLDGTAPENVTVQYNQNGFRALLNKLTFGLFFKDTVSVEAQATDSLSGVDEILYYAAENVVDDVQNITGWQKKLNIEANNKKFVYVKVTDKAGNNVVQLDQGVVVYSDSQVTPVSATFDLKEGNRRDIVFSMDLCGNTLREINSNNVLLLPGEDYFITGNTVTVSESYFSRFNSGTVKKLTFVFDPLGENAGTTTAEVTVAITDSTHHHVAVKHNAEAATCNKNGNKEYYTCTGCDGIFSDAECTTAISLTDTVLPAYHHSGAQKTEAVTEKCTSAGNVAYWHCDKCGKYFADSNGTLNDENEYDNKDIFYKNALGHDWTQWEVITPATFEENGVESRTCTRCQEPESREIPKLVPTIISGQDSTFKKNKDESLVFVCNMTLDEVTVIMVDGNAITPEKYLLESDTSLTLKGEYLNSLDEGSHTLVIKTSSGTAQTSFSVTAESNGANKPSKTGDAGYIALALLLTAVSAACIGITVCKKRKLFER